MAKKTIVDRIFTGSQQTQLEDLVGTPVARRLLPRLADAAASYRRSESDTRSGADRSRQTARSQLSEVEEAEEEIARVLERLDRMAPLVPAAFMEGYLPNVPLRGLLGQLDAPAATLGQMDTIREVLRPYLKTVRTWRERALADTRRKRGRKVGDRPILNEWIVRALRREGVAVTTNPNGRAAKVLTIVYEAIGIAAPADLYRDLRRAVADTDPQSQDRH